MSPNSCFTRDRNVRRNPMRDFSNTRRARPFRCTGTTLCRSDTSSRANSLLPEAPRSRHDSLYAGPAFEHEMHTATGGTIFFGQYPGPTTGAPPIYDGRMNLKEASPLAQQEPEH